MRIRTIKPEFFTHEGIFEAESQSGLPLRLAFIGIWSAADREGRFKWEPRRLGVQILPYDQCDFSRVLDALATRGFIVKYACDAGQFGYIPSFLKHQVINNRERASDLPNPLDCIKIDASTTREARDDDAGKAEGKGKEGNKEGKGMDLLSAVTDASYPQIIETIWPIFPAKSRDRSSKSKLAKAWGSTRPKPKEDVLLDSLQKWAKCHEWTKDGGQFAPGAHIWITDRKWENLPESSSQADSAPRCFPGEMIPEKKPIPVT